MAFVVAGLLNKQIGRELATTGSEPIKFHRPTIMQKMEADSVAELVPGWPTPRAGFSGGPCPKGSEPGLSQGTG